MGLRVISPTPTRVVLPSLLLGQARAEVGPDKSPPPVCWRGEVPPYRKEVGSAGKCR